MTLFDILYQLGDTIGWSLCDYAEDRDGERYGVTDGTVTLGITLEGGAVYWQTSVRCDGEIDTLEDGVCPAGDTRTLLGAWRRAAALLDGKDAE
jgi:hypothetical protein